MTNPTPLSPAAQAVLDAFKAQVELTWLTRDPERVGLAAALRAAADQVVPDDYDPLRGSFCPEKEAFVDGKCVRNEDIRCTILAIAAELEGAHDDPS